MGFALVETLKDNGNAILSLLAALIPSYNDQRLVSEVRHVDLISNPEN